VKSGMKKRLPSICFVAPTAYPLLAGDTSIKHVGGAELQQALIARALAKRGYRVSMVCMNHGQDELVNIDGVTVYRAYASQEGLPILRFVYPRLTSVWKCMKEADADIYYQRATGMLTGVVANFCMRHDRMSIYASASNEDFLRPSPKISFLRDRLLFEYGIRNATSILVQNVEQRDLLQQYYSRDAEVLANGYLPPVEVGRKNNGYILWVSTLRKVKQPHLFLELAKSLPSYHFVMVGGAGSGEQALYDHIHGEAQGARNLDFVGFVPYAKIDQYFDRARLVVNTSLAEGFPNTFLQAWARGIPSLSFVDSGARLEDGSDVEIRCTSLDEMSRHVAELMGNDARWLKKGDTVKAHFEREHSLDRYIEKFEEIITRELKDHTRFRGQYSNT
jgi:glycosyltransferase involved in cell wall biosynthesis